jgi:hypothetical protein
MSIILYIPIEVLTKPPSGTGQSADVISKTRKTHNRLIIKLVIRYSSNHGNQGLQNLYERLSFFVLS